MEDIPQTDLELLIRDKYDGDRTVDLAEDRTRLSEGEPLAYVIGWMPFMGLRIHLDSKPLIPRPETEWWTEELIAHLKERFGNEPFELLDLCAGSGAIGLSALAHLPAARVTFSDIVPEHAALIGKNLEENGIDSSRASIHTSDLFEAIEGHFHVIATNPPYVPSGRVLDASVTGFEPAVALYSDTDGLGLIRRIATEAPAHMHPNGELWMECDIDNIEEAHAFLLSGGVRDAEIRNDPYGRPRIVVGYYA